MNRRNGIRKTTEGPNRRSRGFQRASDMTRGAVDRIASKQGFAEADVLLRWTEIVGAEHSARCRPVKVRYGSRSAGATLVVQASSARAPEIEHLKTRIIDRINQFYGYGAIRNLKVTQSTGLGAIRGFAEEQTAFQGPSAEPSASDQKTASDLAEGIESPGLRAALEEMGAHVLARARKTPT